MSSPELLVVGHVTRDEFGGTIRLGGAGAYAARAAGLLGVRTALVTAAPPDSPLLAALHATPNLTIHCRPSAAITTFALEYQGDRRRLTLRGRADTLAAVDIPPGWRSARVAYVGPVAGECDRRLVQALDCPFIAVGLQGWLRRAGPDGLVEPWLTEEARIPPRGLRLAVFSDQDHPDAERIAANLADAGVLVALTRAAAGAVVLDGEMRMPIPPAPAQEVDPTGAGDVFGVVLAVCLARGAALAQAGQAAAHAAARVVQGPGLGRLEWLGPPPPHPDGAPPAPPIPPSPPIPSPPPVPSPRPTGRGPG